MPIERYGIRCTNLFMLLLFENEGIFALLSWIHTFWLHQRANTRVHAPHWATPRANIAPRRCVVNYKYEHTRVYACKLPWRLYPLVERDLRKRIWLDEISTPTFKVHWFELLRTSAYARTYARRTVRWEYERFNVCARIRAHTRVYTRARSMNPALKSKFW